jgi:hypothetical protein
MRSRAYVRAAGPIPDYCPQFSAWQLSRSQKATENLTGLRKSHPSGTTAKPVRFKHVGEKI